MFGFGRKKRTAEVLVGSVLEALDVIRDEAADSARREEVGAAARLSSRLVRHRSAAQAAAEAATSLEEIKDIFYGDVRRALAARGALVDPCLNRRRSRQEKKDAKQEKFEKLAEVVVAREAMTPIILNMHLLPFEVRGRASA